MNVPFHLPTLSLHGTNFHLVMQVVLFCLFCAAVFLLLYIYRKYRYFITIYHTSQYGTLKFTENGIARLYTPKNGGTRLQRLFERKDYLPLPDDKALSVMKSRRFHINYMRTVEGNYIPIHAPDAIGKDLNSFSELDRQMYINEEERRIAVKKSWKEQIIAIAPIIIMGVIIIMGMVFWQRIASPIIQIQEEQKSTIVEMTGYAKQLTALTEQINILLENQYRISHGEDPVDMPKSLLVEES